MHSGTLLLMPPATAIPPTGQALGQQLRKLGLIGEQWRDNRYLTGDRFLQLITFMGCAPRLQLEPPADGSEHFCHVRLSGPFPTPRLRYAGNSRPPRCPACRRRIAALRDQMPGWRELLPDAPLECPQCAARYPATALDWGDQAGVSRLFIEITEVFPGEAVPVPSLMQKLAGDGAAWRYCYLYDAG